MRSAITVSLVPEARGGPFVYWSGLEAACASAARHGFDAIEIFPPDAEALEVAAITRLTASHGLKVAAIGTGGGWVRHRLTLTHADAVVRRDARAFVSRIIARAGQLGAPAIIGSMQGRWEGSVTREAALDFLAEALAELGSEAARQGVPLIYEPLNRYETNLFNRQADAAAWLRARGINSVRLLADLFHMNLEEADLAGALQAAGEFIGHVHFADSNRHAIGFGHTDVAPVMRALRSIGYSGYLSAEVLPLPDSEAAAAQTIAAIRRAISVS
jgi:sugar phosphate isomerase/epimerase